MRINIVIKNEEMDNVISYRRIFVINKDDNEVIYHFTSLSTALEYMLYNGELRLSPFVNTNDPREIDDWAPTINMTGGIKQLSMEEIKESFNEAKNKAKVICFSEDRIPPQPKAYGVDMHMAPFREKYYKGYYRPRMWAQYTENHKGVCLGINKRKLVDKIQGLLGQTGDVIAKSVNYSDYSPELLSALTVDIGEYELDKEKFIKAQREKYLDYLFFEKSIDWKDEAEFRILYIPHKFSGKEDYLFVDIKDCIETIIIGIYFPEVYIPSLIQLKKEKYPKVRIERLENYNGRPLLKLLEE